MRPVFIVLLLVQAVFPPLAIATVDPRDFRGRPDIEAILKSESELVQNEGPSSPKASAANRIERVSAKFLARPFVDGNLGEGMNGEHDNDPLSRTDVFDCTTLVETVLATILSTDWESFKKNMLRIRYAGGEVHFKTRNHFAEVDWILNNSKRENIFDDVTKALFAETAALAETDIEKAGWYNKMTSSRMVRPDLSNTEIQIILNQLKKETSDMPAEPAKLYYLPYRSIVEMTDAEFETRKSDEARIREAHAGKPTLKEALSSYRRDFLEKWEAAGKVNHALLRKIPSGVIVNYTHPKRPLKELIGTDMLVSHQGFLIWKDGVLYARHASQGDKVVDIKFIEYLNQFLVPGKLNLEPQGINVLQVKNLP